ncbi:MAG: zinc carboxypeptidase, partial [Marinirhabdus sp.]
SLSYGSLWHFFEKQLKYPVTSIGTGSFSASALKNFDVLLLPSGWYGRSLNENMMKEITKWVRSGGKIIAMGNALRVFAGKEGFDLKQNKKDTKKDSSGTGRNLVPYEKRELEGIKNFITGSIYKITMDPSHPMAFGYGGTYHSLKLGGSSYSFLEKGYNVGYIKGDAQSVAGFSGDAAKAGLKNSMTFGEARVGRGSVVYFVDDVLFRSFWENGKLLLVNSIFFVNNNAFVL